MAKIKIITGKHIIANLSQYNKRSNRIDDIQRPKGDLCELYGFDLKGFKWQELSRAQRNVGLSFHHLDPRNWENSYSFSERLKNRD